MSGVRYKTGCGLAWLHVAMLSCVTQEFHTASAVLQTYTFLNTFLKPKMPTKLLGDPTSIFHLNNSCQSGAVEGYSRERNLVLP